MNELIEEAREYIEDAKKMDRGMSPEEVTSFMTRLLLQLSIEEAKKNV